MGAVIAEFAQDMSQAPSSARVGISWDGDGFRGMVQITEIDFSLNVVIDGFFSANYSATGAPQLSFLEEIPPDIIGGTPTLNVTPVPPGELSPLYGVPPLSAGPDVDGLGVVTNLAYAIPLNAVWSGTDGSGSAIGWLLLFPGRLLFGFPVFGFASFFGVPGPKVEMSWNERGFLAAGGSGFDSSTFLASDITFTPWP